MSHHHWLEEARKEKWKLAKKIIKKATNKHLRTWGTGGFAGFGGFSNRDMSGIWSCKLSDSKYNSGTDDGVSSYNLNCLLASSIWLTASSKCWFCSFTYERNAHSMRDRETEQSLSVTTHTTDQSWIKLELSEKLIFWWRSSRARKTTTPSRNLLCMHCNFILTFEIYDIEIQDNGVKLIRKETDLQQPNSFRKFSHYIHRNWGGKIKTHFWIQF